MKWALAASLQHITRSRARHKGPKRIIAVQYTQRIGKSPEQIKKINKIKKIKKIEKIEKIKKIKKIKKKSKKLKSAHFGWFQIFF